jgi:NADH-quinone oxidoreductase subunit H
MNEIIWAMLILLVFPGFLFLFAWSLVLEWWDRKLYARLQNRVGPRFIQPEADFIKLLAKEDIVTKSSDGGMLYMLPLISFAAVCATIIYIPVWAGNSVVNFQGDLLMVSYLLTIPTVALFLIGWHSANLFAAVGSQRAMTQLFAYEVPLLLVLVSPAILAGSWSISDITQFQMDKPWAMWFTLFPGFFIALFMMQAKMERTPFDIPDAETEIVGGPLTEISGKKLALMRLTFDILMVTGAALIAALFLGGFTLAWDGWAGWSINAVLFLVKTMFIVFLLSAVRALFARLRIDQMVDFSWSWMAPLAILQVFIVILAKYFDLVEVVGGWL